MAKIGSMAFLLLSLLCLFAVMVGFGDSVSLAAAFPKVPLSDVMQLEVVTSSSGMAVHEALSSSEVLLRVSFTDGHRHGDVSLFDCVAISDDGTHLMQLTDSTGCPALKSPMGCMVEENDLLISPAFELSSLADFGDVNITCSWEMCYTPHHPKCKNRCEFFTTQANLGNSRHRRSGDSEGSRDARRHSISTRIRVLPSHVRHRHHHGSASASASSFGHHGHHGSSHNMQSSSETLMPAAPSAIMYLNPIVCSLFLLILSVFLGFYVSFVRSLSRTVQHIKTEIERQRARDKFIVPGCHD